MARPPSRSPAHRAVRGFSLVELMVGMAIALFIAAGAATLAASQVGDQRRLALDTQIQQELRAAADMLVREVRRAGHWGAAERGLPVADGAKAAANPYADTSPAPVDGPTQEIRFVHSRDAVENGVVDSADRSGFRLHKGTIEMLMGGAGWQALTDAATFTVTRFDITLRETPIALPCARACAAEAVDCPPTQVLREVDVLITAQAVHDARLQRSVRGGARLRNDMVRGRCPGQAS